jgi:tRNA nucleotidyltransferase (CCA-adding enzyme)
MRALPRRDLPLVAAVLRAARGRGAAVYLVGGPVRDLLLERPLRDVDLLVVPPEGGELAAGELARAAAPEGAQVTLHERFGTVTLSAGDAAIDLASARTERYPRPGALPEVQPGTLEEDLRRRDFSVNALALRLSGPARRGELELVDADDGLRDLEARRLRILHRRSFHDDPTRALRAARLAPRLGFALSRGSRSALRDALRDGAFGAVSGDRLRREIEKLFDDVQLGLDPSAALRRLAEWHVLPALEPGLDLPREAAAPLRRLGRAIASPPWSGPRWRAWAAGLSTWLAPLAPDLRRRTLRRFSVRGELERRVAGFPRLRDGTLAALSGARGRGAVDAVLGELDEERLFALYAWSPPAIRRRIVRWAAEDRTRRPPVTGADLVAAGLSGPSVGRALARIRAAYLDGGVANREEAIALARELERRRPRPGRRKR